jgi:hypothetical protein
VGVELLSWLQLLPELPRSKKRRQPKPKRIDVTSSRSLHLPFSTTSRKVCQINNYIEINDAIKLHMIRHLFFIIKSVNPPATIPE